MDIQPQIDADRLGRAIAAARRAATVPAYKREWQCTPEEITDSTWADLPLLTKYQLIAGAAAEPPYGNRLAVPSEDLGWIFVAPGPVFMPYTAADLDQVTVAYGRGLNTCGIDRHDIVDQTLLYNWVIAATMIDRGLASIGCAVIPGGPGQTEQHADVISTAGVTAIIAMPSFLEHLLSALDGRPHSLRKAVILGELSDAQAKVRIAEKHGIEVREFYGVADVGAVAYECSVGNGMHLRPDLLVEFVDPQTGRLSMPEKTRPAELVVTDFGREAMPIIRLRTGDLVDELQTETCRCGDASPRIQRIIGRSSDITKVRGMFIVPQQISRALLNAGIESRHCVLADHVDGRDVLEVLVAGKEPGNYAEIKAALERAVRISIQLRFVDDLPADSGLFQDRRTYQTK